MEDIFVIAGIDCIQAFISITDMMKNDAKDNIETYTDNTGRLWKLEALWVESINKNVIVLCCNECLTFEYLFYTLQNSNDNEVVGVISMIIYFRKFDDYNNMELLMNYLESDKNLSAEKIRIIIHETELFDASNRRDIIGKSYREVLKDAEYFKSIASRAKKLL